jgi:hypothetical protein
MELKYIILLAFLFFGVFIYHNMQKHCNFFHNNDMVKIQT